MMKKILLFLSLIFFTATTFAQDAVSKGYLEAYFNSDGMISYRNHGEITKDGIMVIDLKTSALNNYVAQSKVSPAQMELIENEKQSLDKLRERILVQREKMIKPLPPMEEIH
jgi:hypothetical protein